MKMPEINRDNLVRIGSHRARQKLWGLLGGAVQTYFSWERDGEWCEVPPEKREAALQIKGISPGPREVSDLRHHIKWST